MSLNIPHVLPKINRCSCISPYPALLSCSRRKLCCALFSFNLWIYEISVQKPTSITYTMQRDLQCWVCSRSWTDRGKLRRALFSKSRMSGLICQAACMRCNMVSGTSEDSGTSENSGPIAQSCDLAMPTGICHSDCKTPAFGQKKRQVSAKVLKLIHLRNLRKPT